jgi:hypothetical protein
LIKEYKWQFQKQVIESILVIPEEEFTDVDVLLERIMLFNKIEAREKNIAKARLTQQKKLKKSYQNGFDNLAENALSDIDNIASLSARSQNFMLNSS